MIVSAKLPRRMPWLDTWLDAGYTITRGGSGHFLVRDPDGRLAASIAGTPSCAASGRAAQAHLRRHERSRNSGTGQS